MTAPLTRTDKPATDLAVGDRTDRSGKSRVAVVHRRGDFILAKITTRGARSATIARYPADATVTVWNAPPTAP
jgi:hypothetical protein